MDLDRRNSSSTGRSVQKLPRTNSQVDLKPAEDRDDEEMVDAALGADITMDESEWDLSMRLELARKNSQSQEVGKQPYAVRSAFRRERTISEDHPMEGGLMTNIFVAFSLANLQSCKQSRHPLHSLRKPTAVQPSSMMPETLPRLKPPSNLTQTLLLQRLAS